MSVDMDEVPMVLGKPMYYRLDADHNILPASRGEMIAMYEGDFETTRRVGRTKVGDQDVSTVFLGIDHGFDRHERPVLFETMIFGGDHDEYQWRYSTWDEAKAGHDRIVAALRAGESPA